MIWNIDQVIAEASKYFTLKTGDLIFTGTPAGVGRVVPGDVLEGELNGKEIFRLSIK
jgi:2-keto-4-pentenoate hydratase/2-oxohepta-3-ene-1,7-dioic acid hydratase in catechol pathway